MFKCWRERVEDGRASDPGQWVKPVPGRVGAGSAVRG